jgi:transposase
LEAGHEHGVWAENGVMPLGAVAQITQKYNANLNSVSCPFLIMMGVHIEQKSLFAYGINLDDRVRWDHPLRRIAEAIDFSFVRDEVRELYGRKGNESVNPEVILKLMFLLFLDNVKSERELMRIIPERLDYLWFLGYGLDDDIPNYSVLSKARNRWGRDV